MPTMPTSLSQNLSFPRIAAACVFGIIVALVTVGSKQWSNRQQAGGSGGQEGAGLLVDTDRPGSQDTGIKATSDNRSRLVVPQQSSEEDEEREREGMVKLIAELYPALEASGGEVRPDQSAEGFMLQLLGLLHPNASNAALQSLLHVTQQYPELLIGAKPFKDEPTSKETVTTKTNLKHSEPPKWLCVKLPGNNIRFGNFMFIYAAAYVVALKTGRRLIMDDRFEELKNVFTAPDFDTVPGDRLNFMTLELTTYAQYHTLPEIPADKDICLSGYFQSWHFFKEYTAEIREQFKFKDAILETASEITAALCQRAAKQQNTSADQVRLVGIHVRHSDMSSRGAQDYGYSLPSLQYFHKAMLYFLARYPHVHFVLATDSTDWAQRNLRDRLKSDFIDLTLQERFEVDLAVLSLCDHVIVSSGTFSWWAGWLSGGDVVYYNAPVRKNSRLGVGFEPRDYFPPNWIPMS